MERKTRIGLPTAAAIALIAGIFAHSSTWKNPILWWDAEASIWAVGL
jgi:hypothetical protein